MTPETAICVSVLAVILLVLWAGLISLGRDDLPDNWGPTFPSFPQVAKFTLTSTLTVIAVAMCLWYGALACNAIHGIQHDIWSWWQVPFAIAGILMFIGVFCTFGFGMVFFIQGFANLVTAWTLLFFYYPIKKCHLIIT